MVYNIHMWNNIKAFFEFSSRTGLYLPAAYDAVADGPSISLLLVHISAWLAAGTIIYLTTQDAIAGAVAAVVYVTLMTTFYMMRKLTTAKFDLDDRSFELGNQEKEEK